MGVGLMIKNDIELAKTRQQVEQVIASKSQLREDEEKQLIDSDRLLQKLQMEIAEYEALVAHNPDNPILLEVESAEQIFELPIKASLAFKITPQELAEICQLDNSTDCASDSESDLFRVMNILGFQLIDGLFFVAKMSDELKQKLQSMRIASNLDRDVQLAS